MTGSHDNGFVLRRISSAIAAHRIHHYVGPTILDKLAQIEQLTQQLPEITDELEKMRALNSMLTLEKEIKDYITAAKLSNRAARERRGFDSSFFPPL